VTATLAPPWSWQSSNPSPSPTLPTFPSPSILVDVNPFPVFPVHSYLRCSQRSPHLPTGLRKLGEERRHSSGHSFCCHFLHFHYPLYGSSRDLNGPTLISPLTSTLRDFHPLSLTRHDFSTISFTTPCCRLGLTADFDHTWGFSHNRTHELHSTNHETAAQRAESAVGRCLS
jgi:hypothetical protein